MTNQTSLPRILPQCEQQEQDSRYIHLPNEMIVPKPFCARSSDEREAWLDRVRATKKHYRILRENAKYILREDGVVVNV